MRYTVFGLALLLLVTSAGSAQLTETKIAFTSNRDGNDEIYVMNADGTNPVNLTNNPAEDRGPPIWSPDGTQIFFGSNRDGNFEVYVMNADGSNPVNLTNNPAEDNFPSWFSTRPTVGVSPKEKVATTWGRIKGDFAR